MRATLLFLGLIFAQAAFAGDSHLNYEVSLSWANAIAGTQLRETPANPGNLLAVPDLEGLSLLRPSFKAWIPGLVFVARPQFEYTPNQVTKNGQATTAYQWNSTDFHFNDLYLQGAPTDTLFFAYGLQNYQWGPAETFSPSNTIFHETVLSKDYLFEFRGHHLVRANLTPTKEWSFVLIAEVTGNGDPPFVYGQTFQPQALLKSEHSWNSGADYFGLVLNWQRASSGGWGEYGNLSFDNGLSLYLDAHHTFGSQAWYPVTQFDAQSSTSFTGFQQSQAGDRGIYTLAVAGVRYAFTGGTDARIEYVYDQAAYSASQQDRIRSALSSTDPTQLAANSQSFAVYRANGQEFAGQNLVSFSARIPSVLGLKALELYARYMHSLTDQSGAGYAAIQYDVGGSGSLFAAGGINHGDPVSELSGAASSTWMGGYKHSW